MHSRQKGFTLTELVIAVIILGIITSFFIPQLLASTRTQYNAKIKDTVALIESSVKNCSDDSSCTWSSNNTLYDYFVNPAAFPAVAKWIPLSNGVSGFGPGTPPNSVLPGTHPCLAGIADAEETGYIQLKSGQTISGLAGSSSFIGGSAAARSWTLCIDANGNNGPNQPGVDVRLGTFTLNAIHQGPTSSSFQWGNSVTSIATNDASNNLNPPSPLQAPFTSSPNASAGGALSDQ